MSTQSETFKERTILFALEILGMIDTLPRGVGSDVVARQLAKSASSVGANYRAACICRSRLEFISKLGVVLEEADECVYWLELIARARWLPPGRVAGVLDEARQLRAVFGKSVATARSNQRGRTPLRSPINNQPPNKQTTK